jgi:GNAT superfamily N-acetyltransferase
VPLKYQQEFLDTFKKDVGDLLQKDYEEIEHNKELRNLDPDWDIYNILETQGSLMIFTCRDDLTLVGYFVVVTPPDLHSKGSVLAVADVIFLDKEYRVGLTGYKLFKFAEDCVRKDGFKTLHVTTTEMNPIDPLMSRLGYSKIETKYEKVL